MARANRKSPRVVAQLDTLSDVMGSDHMGPDDVRFADYDEDDGDWSDARGAASLSSINIKRDMTTLPPPVAAQPDDIIAYWTSLRRGDALPDPGALDEHHVIAQWPGSVLMRLVEGTPMLVRRFAGSGDAEPQGAVAAMQIQWIQSLTREALQSACPLRDDTTFPAGTLAARETRCRAIAVPLGQDSEHPDHALCWVMTEG